MNRLIQSGLMFGNLIRVDSPALIDRYNRALQHLTGQQTALTEFHIDISGFAPEIGDELGDPLYLNHHGVNRQFILLTTEQKTAPLLDATFSTSRSILRRFIETNEAQLFALTARDAVAGELVNSVFSLTTPARLLDIRKITVEADTTGGTLRQARELAEMVDEFKTREDAWFDDPLIARMIGAARNTGDILRNPVLLETMSFETQNFWTSHFGGCYLFRAVDRPALITAGDKTALQDLPIGAVFDLSDRSRIARFLESNRLVEPIVTAPGLDAAAILRQKMDFIVVDAAQDAGIDLTGATRRDIRHLARRHAGQLPEAYHGLGRLVHWAEGAGDWPRITSEHPSYFLSLRAADTPDRDLVNMLLAELAPRDIRQLFICHKQLFYQLYRAWSETKRSYVVDFLTREYQVDKAGARAALFGHEPPMQEPGDDLIARVGPWGAVRGR
ncbi:DUF6638 family protein [Marinovum algicola]|uniref:DUF6638 family protein n=1 Tax=Marinovum algicola TaxID=42444 RepID=UPI0024B9E7D8|nr:DUF6638 family protein [Marinovum algicola]